MQDIPLHICILSQNHLCRNPRVVKEAGFLRDAGCKVSVLTLWYSDELLKLDRAIPGMEGIAYSAYLDLRNKNIRTIFHRMQFRVLRQITAYTGIEFEGTAGYAPEVLFQKALQENADMYIAHQELPTFAGIRLIRKGKKVAFDFEDWYSRDLLDEDRKSRPITLLEKAEKDALQNALWCTTTSDSLAEALQKFSGGERPVCVYNGFSLNERKNQKLSEPESTFDKIRFAWISQVIGPGRGLEEAIQFIESAGIPAEIHLAGNLREGYMQSLNLSLQNKKLLSIVVHPVMPPGEILSWLRKYDIGLATDLPISPSRNLTVTNKILHYLLAGIPVLASNTLGHLEIREKCQGSVILMESTEDFSAQMSLYLNEAETRTRLKKTAWTDGIQFCWENQVEKLQLLFSSKSDQLKSK